MEFEGLNDDGVPVEFALLIPRCSWIGPPAEFDLERVVGAPVEFALLIPHCSWIGPPAEFDLERVVGAPVELECLNSDGVPVDWTLLIPRCSRPGAPEEVDPRRVVGVRVELALLTKEGALSLMPVGVTDVAPWYWLVLRSVSCEVRVEYCGRGPVQVN